MGVFRNLFKSIKCILLEVGAVIVALLIYVISPILILLITPLFIYRMCICQLAKKFKPELRKMVPTRSAMFAVDDPYNKPLLNIVVTVVFEGDMDIEILRNEFEKMLEVKFPNGEIAYPELKQYVHLWGGYLFWKDVANFNICDYIKCWEENKNSEGFYEGLDDKQYRNIVRHLTFKNFPLNSALWEMVLLKNFKPKCAKAGVHYSAFIFRLNHGLGDGYSALNLLMKLLDESGRDKVAKPNFVERNRCKTLLYFLSCFFKFPYEIGKILLTTWDTNDFVGPKRNLSRLNSIDISERFSLEIIKEIKNIHNVSFSSVISAAVAGGIRNCMLKRKMKIPAKVTCVLGLPVPGHSEKLRNNATIGLVVYPLGIADPVKRLQIINNNFEKLRHSSFSTIAYYLQPIGGLVFVKTLRWWPGGNVPVTTILSNFPGPSDPIVFSGNKVVDVFFCQGFGRVSLSISFGALSSFGMVKIGCAVDRSIFPTDEDAKELLTFVMEELEILRKRDIRV